MDDRYEPAAPQLHSLTLESPPRSTGSASSSVWTHELSFHRVAYGGRCAVLTSQDEKSSAAGLRGAAGGLPIKGSSSSNIQWCTLILPFPFSGWTSETGLFSPWHLTTTWTSSSSPHLSFVFLTGT
ncbi:unnamed protein product [Merluccius merluccius]